MPELQETLGFRYFQESKFDPAAARAGARPNVAPAEPFKFYPGVEIVELPRDFQDADANLLQLLQQRRSLRKYAERSLGLTELAMLLWAGQGITGQAGAYLFRTAPSAGALYPIETYLAVDKVDGLPPGLYHFNVQNFSLERLRDGSVGHALAQACLGQTFMAKGAVTFAWSAVMRRTMSKYGHRAMRYILLDAGHVCQNILLAAEAVGFGGCPIAAFVDDEVNALLELDGQEESVVYLASIGAKK